MEWSGRSKRSMSSPAKPAVDESNHKMVNYTEAIGFVEKKVHHAYCTLDHSPKSKKELSARKGQHFQVLNQSFSEEWWQVESDDGTIGLLPKSVLQKARSLSESVGVLPGITVSPPSQSQDDLGLPSPLGAELELPLQSFLMMQRGQRTESTSLSHTSSVSSLESDIPATRASDDVSWAKLDVGGIDNGSSTGSSASLGKEEAEVSGSNILRRNSSSMDSTSNASLFYIPNASMSWIFHHCSLGYLVFNIKPPNRVNLLLNEKGLDFNATRALRHLQKLRDDVTNSIRFSIERTLKAIESYLPYATGLSIVWDSLEKQDKTSVISKKGSRIMFSWPSVVGVHSYSHTYDSESPHFDEVMMCSLYSFLLCNRASFLQHGTGSDAQEASSESIELLQKAAGGLQYIATVSIPAWKNLPLLKPPELIPEVALALSSFCLAEAQSIYLKQRLQNQPPLNNTEAAALSKGVSDLIHNGIASMKGSKFSLENFVAIIKFYVKFQSHYHDSLSKKFLAEQAFQEGKYEHAVGLIKQSFEILKETSRSCKGNRLGEIRKKELMAQKELHNKFSKQVKRHFFRAKPDLRGYRIPGAIHVKAVEFSSGTPIIFSIGGISPAKHSTAESQQYKLISFGPVDVEMNKKGQAKYRVVLNAWKNTPFEWKSVWLEIVNGYLLIYSLKPTNQDDSDPEETMQNSNVYSRDGTYPRKVFSLEGLAVTINEIEEKSCFRIKGPSFTYDIGAGTSKDLEGWMMCFLKNAQTSHRYSSFVGVRQNINCRWFVDAENTYSAMATAILNAKEDIFIANWFLIPEIFMKRGPKARPENSRFDKLLQRKAREGVKIFVLVWNETSFVMNLKSANAKGKLESLHKNIVVVRHPGMAPTNWSHNQKLLVVDQNLAFIGGFDICYGRYDTQNHVIVDPCHLSSTWPGKDYSNPTVKGIVEAEKPWDDSVDRAVHPRMGWHDVHCAVDGAAARDIASNFIQRYNHHKSKAHPLIMPKLTTPKQTGTCSVQVVRSICEWSGGNRREYSIYKAYLGIIQKAKHFIYIENQFFISSTSGGTVENKIAEVIYEKIRQAIVKQGKFKVIVVLPDSNFRSVAVTRYIMKFQYNTISKGGNSLMERLNKEFPGVNISDYISFFSLRNYGWIEDQVVTEQIYVHSKVMIVDDRTCVLGSANINDKSMRGDRDSEIAVVVQDTQTVDIEMNGLPYSASQFAHTLRMNLMAEHLGLKQEQVGCMQDLLSDGAYKETWLATAQHNTSIYDAVFPSIPKNSIHSIANMKAANDKQPVEPERLAAIKGHLVFFPVDYLKNENLVPSAKESHLVTDASIFI